MTKDDDNTYYTYTVAIGDDNDATVTFKNTDQLSGQPLGYTFEYKMDGDYVKSGSVTTADVANTTVRAANGDYVVLNNNVTFNVDDVTLYTATYDYDDWDTTAPVFGEDAPDSVVVSEGGSYSVDDIVIYTVDGDDDVVNVYIVELVW